MRLYRFSCFGALALGLLVWGPLGTRWVEAQVTAIDEDFEEDDPCEVDSGWVCVGNRKATDPLAPPYWVSPDDPLNLFNPPEGYVRVTDSGGDTRGLLWRTEKILYDNFRLVAEVELFGGSSPPADGMAIVIIGADTVPGEGTFAGGGGLSATGHGSFPTMIFEFDNWNNGAPDRANNNHVGFEYQANGFPATDQLPSDAFAIVPVPLNGSGKFLFEVLVQGGAVACDLTNQAAGLPKTRMYTYQIPNFQPFEGFLGVTGSTGGSNQNHILHSIRIDQLPPDFCLVLPAEASRTITGPTMEAREATPANPGGTPTPVWQEGDVLDVEITVFNLREDTGFGCGRPTSIVVTESPPDGWTPTDISDGGTYDAGKGDITWVLEGAALAEGTTVGYKVASVDNTFEAVFLGSIAESATSAELTGITGLNSVQKDSPFDACGGIRVWNILGWYDNPEGSAALDSTLQADFMTDGQDTEFDFLWFPGATINTDFAIAASSSIGGGANGWNPGGVPTVLGWLDNDSLIDLNEAVFGGDPDNAMAYAQCYVVNTTEDVIEAFLGVSSDDSVAVIWNEEYYWVHSVARGGSSACTPLDVTDFEVDGLTPKAPLIIDPGENVLIVKTFEGATDFNFSLRFQDEDGNPITDGLEICLDLEECGSPVVTTPKFHRGDADADGAMNITDGIFVLNYLFLGGGTPRCLEAANTNGDADINITDGIYVLNFLFLGGPAPPAPGPNTCGVDPRGEGLGCLSFPPCE